MCRCLVSFSLCVFVCVSMCVFVCAFVTFCVFVCKCVRADYGICLLPFNNFACFIDRTSSVCVCVTVCVCEFL